MQRLSAAIIIATGLIWGAAATAQPMNGAQIANQCTVEGAFGQRFGQQVVGSADGGSASQFVGLPASFAPFRRAEVSVTPNTGLVHSVAGVAQFNSEADARAAFDAAIAALHADSRFATSLESSVREGKTFYTGEPFGDDGLAAEIWIESRELVYFCSDAALAQRAFDERTGWR